jgi:unsaturated rhamnogalacturonyl hydrolase
MSSICQEDVYFMQNMKQNNIAGDDIEKYRFWEWPQGVGLYGLWKLYTLQKDNEILSQLENSYDDRIKQGLPAKNINTCAPLLALSYLYEVKKKQVYKEVLLEWGEWIMFHLPRTHGGGFQHITSDSINEEEIWDDTLFMTVMVLFRVGMLFNEKKYIQEAIYQVLFHSLYLLDRESGLWFYGFTFKERNHFAGALWARGNSWITITLPVFLSSDLLSESEEKILRYIYKEQIDNLLLYQDESSGMWHTLINDSESYLETSGSAGIAYGVLEGVKTAILEESYNNTQKNLYSIS